jgi:hypothetical protein
MDPPLDQPPRWLGEAQDETRTRDPFLTMEVLYQLSYLGGLDLKITPPPDNSASR